MTSEWYQARAPKGESPWRERVTIKNGDFLETIISFEEGDMKTTALVAGRVQNVSAAQPQGVLMDLVFIGSDDREILKLWLPGQSACTYVQ